MLTAETRPAHHSICCPHCGKVAATVSVVVAGKVDDTNGKCAEQASEMLLKTIDTHPWPGRLRNAFTNFVRCEEVDGEWKHVGYPIKTFADLCAINRFDLAIMPNVGRVSIAHVEEVLASYGLHLAER